MPKGLVRYQKSGDFHFITFSCYRRLPFLAERAAYMTFESELEAVRRRYGFVVAGYVLMPEHVHLLVGEPLVSSLSVVLQVLKQKTSRKVKKMGDLQFWQRRYYDFNVNSELKTVEKLRYMHRNPGLPGARTLCAGAEVGKSRIGRDAGRLAVVEFRALRDGCSGRG